MSKYTRIYITSELGSPGSLTITELSSPGSPTFAAADDEPRGEPLVRISTAVHEPLTIAAAKAVRVLQDRADAARTGLQAMGLYEPPPEVNLGTDLRNEIAKIVKPEEDETLVDAVVRWGTERCSEGYQTGKADGRVAAEQKSDSAITQLRAEISEARTVLEARPDETAPEAARRVLREIREAVDAAGQAIRDAYARKPCPAASEPAPKYAYTVHASKYKVGDRVVIDASCGGCDEVVKRHHGTIVTISGWSVGDLGGHLYTTKTLDGSTEVLAWERELAACPHEGDQ